METVDTILREKGAEVLSVSPHTTVLQAVEAMCAKKVGAVLVCEQGQPAGMFSERDLMTRVILKHRNPATTRVEEVMSTEIAYVERGTDTREAMAIMTERRCRHLPVVAEGKVVGMISIGDLVRATSRDHEFEIRVLTDYICGKYPG